MVLGKKHASKWRGYTSSVLKHAETVTFLLLVLHYFWHWTRCWGNKSFLLSTSWCDLMRLWSSFGPLYAVHNLDVSMAIVEGRRIGSMKNVSNVEKRSNVQSLLIWISIGLCSMDYGRLQVQEPQSNALKYPKIVWIEWFLIHKYQVNHWTVSTSCSKPMHGTATCLLTFWISAPWTPCGCLPVVKRDQLRAHS